MPAHRRPLRALLLPALLLVAVGCGGGPAVLDRAAGLEADDRARITGFRTTLDAAQLASLVPPEAPQRIDLRPGSLVESGLSRYLPILSAELAKSMRAFEDESGVPALEAFHRLLFWSEAPTVDALDRARSELLFAFDGATLVDLIEWLEKTPMAEAKDADQTETPADDGVYAGALFVAAFSRLDAAQLAKIRAVMDNDPQRVETYVLGPETRLVTARGQEGEAAVRWSMWAFSWPGGFIAERALGDELTLPERALVRLAGHLERIEEAAGQRPVTQPADRVLTARVRGPDPIALDLDMGETVGLSITAPVALLAEDMSPAMLVAGWPMMKLTLINGLDQGLRESGIGADFGPLLAGVIRASELRMNGDRLIWSTALPRRAFEALLPTM